MLSKTGANLDAMVMSYTLVVWFSAGESCRVDAEIRVHVQHGKAGAEVKEEGEVQVHFKPATTTAIHLNRAGANRALLRRRLLSPGMLEAWLWGNFIEDEYCDWHTSSLITRYYLAESHFRRGLDRQLTVKIHGFVVLRNDLRWRAEHSGRQLITPALC